MRRVLVIVLVILGMMYAYSPKGEDTTSRPKFKQGVIKIQLTEETVIKKNFTHEYNIKFSKFDIISLDNLNSKNNVSSLRKAHITAKNVKAQKDFGLDRWYIIDIPEDTNILQVIEDYKKDPNVESAIPEYLIYTLATPTDPMYADQWGHNNTAQMLAWKTGDTYVHTGSPVGTVGFDANAQSGWDGSQGYGSSTVVIGIIDTGVDTGHEDLDLVTGYDFGDNDTNPMDDSGAAGHGTGCAGIAAGIVNNGKGVAGVSGNSKIMPLKIADSGGSMSFTAIENALMYGADNGADVLSLSLGADIDYGDSPSTDTAVSYAYDAGVVILVATANNNFNHIFYPSNHPDAIAVGAAAPDNGRKRSSSSSVNPGNSTDPNGVTIDNEGWWGSNYGSTSKDANDAVDIIAPCILTTTDISGNSGYQNGDYYGYFNGTSSACPYAAGFAGLIKSKYPTYTPDQIRSLMTSTALDVVNVESGSGWDRYSGYGIIDIGAALNDGGTPPPMPTLISPSNGSSTSDATPTFDWSDASGATSYTILVDDASNFSSPEINQSPTSSTFTSGTGLATGVYYWKVLATNSDGSSSYTTAWDFTITPSVPMPGMPTLITPNDGSTVEDLTPTFDWSDASDATGYEIQISTKSNMTGLVVDTSVGTSEYTPPSNLAEDIYYWRVLATNSAGSSSYTGVWDVNVIAPPPPPGDLTLISPTDGSDTFDKTPAFDWNNAVDATGYEIIVDNNADFLSPEIDQATATSDYTQPTDLALGTYYWKARGTNSVGAGNYSGTWSFNVIAPPPGTPTLISPTNGSGTTDTTPTFVWSDEVDAMSYTILVDNNSDYSSPEIDQTVGVSTYTAGSALLAGTYYWKVLATNMSGSSAYTGTWTVDIQAPDVDLPIVNLSNTVAPDASVQDLFDIDNLGDANLDYNITFDYVTAKGDIFFETETFATDFGSWTVSGTAGYLWTRVTDYDGGNTLDGTPFIVADGTSTANGTSTTLTSTVYDVSGVETLYLDFDQYYNTGRSGIVEVFDGSTWQTVYTAAAGTGSWATPDVQNVDVSAHINANFQVRFTYSSKRNTYWALDNLSIWGTTPGPVYTWLTINSPISGTVTPAGSNTIDITCDAIGLAEATYNANITIASNDPDEPSRVVSVEFIVFQSTIIPAIPINIVTSISGTDLVVDWDVSADATGYDVYSSDDPYGTFTLAASVGTNQYIVPADQAKLFYYIVATNSTK